MLDIISFISSFLLESSAKAILPSSYAISYTNNMAKNEPFGINYYSKINDWDINASAMWRIMSSRSYFHEFSFQTSRLTPSLSLSDAQDFKRVLGLITGINNLSMSEVEGILGVKAMSVLYSIFLDYPINKVMNIYISSGFGIAKIIQYQGFRRYAEDSYGPTIKVRFGISYKLKPGLESYVGYSYKKDFWKYKSDTIYDEEGNSIQYKFEDFEFSQHGLEVGIRFTNLKYSKS